MSAVLIVDDDPAMCAWVAESLARRGHTAATTTSGEEALALLRDREFEAVVTDLRMSGLSGVELCERCVANHPDTPVIVVTAFGNLETAIAAIRAGAYDFITKPLEIEDLALALERAVQHRRLRDEVRRLRRAVVEAQSFGPMIGESLPMRKLYDILGRVAPSTANVLVTGETGTGKELVARALHERSPRASGPFIAVSCAAMPESILESELFGHVKGAYTDARSDHTGLFVQADGGTLFLDEIGEVTHSTQVKLLRALEERTVRPLGATSEVRIATRIVAATNRDLEAAVEEGQFREDLFYRLNVIHVTLPPLRARGNDILLIAQHLVEMLAARAGKDVVGISSAAAARLLAYSWPGNVRELRNCIERAVALTRYEELAVEDLPDKIQRYEASSHLIVAGQDPSELATLDEVERRYVLRVLESVGGNKTVAAKVLGLDRRTLYRKLERYASESGRWALRSETSDEVEA